MTQNPNLELKREFFKRLLPPSEQRKSAREIAEEMGIPEQRMTRWLENEPHWTWGVSCRYGWFELEDGEIPGCLKELENVAPHD